jgi:hypothetical protein
MLGGMKPLVFLRTCLTSVALAAATGPTCGATFYCDPVAGNPQGDGSAARPWGSLERLLADRRIRITDDQGQTANPDAPVGPGDTVLLRSGWHGVIRIPSGYNAQTITLAAEPGQTPQVGWVEIGAACNWTLRGLTVSPSLAPAPLEHVPKGLVTLGERAGAGSNLVVESCFIFSALDTSAWNAQEWITKPAGGIMLGRNGRGHVARDNDVLNTRFGISLCAPDCVAEGNLVERFSGDGIRVTRSGQQARLNVIKNIFVSASDGDDNHDDGIQAFPFNNMKEPVCDVTISENVILACEDDALPFRAPMQGIGCFDGPLVRFQVTGNVVCVNTWHGLSLYDAQGCVISNNVVYSRWSNREQPWIMLGTKKKQVQANRVTGNHAKNGFHLKVDPQVTSADNAPATEQVYEARRAELLARIQARFGAMHPVSKRPRQ